MTDADDPLRALTERVQRLEELVGDDPCDPPATVDGHADGDGDVFWVLEGLERRHGAQAVTYAGSLVVDGGPVRWQRGHDTEQLLELDWTALAPALSALGHPARLHILQLIARGEATTAADLAGRPGLGSTGQIYHHLRQLTGAGWLRATTKGRHEVPPERLVPLLVILGAGSA